MYPDSFSVLISDGGDVQNSVQDCKESVFWDINYFSQFFSLAFIDI